MSKQARSVDIALLSRLVEDWLHVLNPVPGFAVVLCDDCDFSASAVELPRVVRQRSHALLMARCYRLGLRYICNLSSVAEAVARTLVIYAISLAVFLRLVWLHFSGTVDLAICSIDLGAGYQFQIVTVIVE